MTVYADSKFAAKIKSRPVKNYTVFLCPFKFDPYSLSINYY